MSWKYLNAATLATKANVLAGPVLRKVTPDSVTVWFALQKKATVTLTVMDAAGVRLFDSVVASGPGTGDTIAVGANLHIVAVTAKRKTGEPQLLDGVTYTYDAAFVYAPPPAGQAATAPQSSIAAATTGSAGAVPKLTYTGFTRPSFCLPARNINNLRILHGSCRKAAGDGLDALAIVDTLIEEKANLPVERPQQLLLTGDQIYADDVAPSLLVMLTDAATCLLGWDELLPTAPPKRTPASQLPPYSRRPILEVAKFTSDDLDSHLMSVGEYLCM